MEKEWIAVSGNVEPSNASQPLRPTLVKIQDLTRTKDLETRLKTVEEVAAKSQARSEGQIQHLLKGNAELNEGNEHY